MLHLARATYVQHVPGWTGANAVEVAEMVSTINATAAEPTVPSWAVEVEPWDYDVDGTASRSVVRRIFDKSLEISELQVWHIGTGAVTTDGVKLWFNDIDYLYSDTTRSLMAEMRTLAAELIEAADVLEQGGAA